MLQSKEMAVRRDKTVSQPIDIPSCEIKLCHSQWRCLNERYNCITVLRESIRRDITVSQWIEMDVRIDITVLQSVEMALGVI